MRLLIIVIGTCLLAALAVAGDLWVRPPHPSAASAVWMRALSLTRPALWPAGDPRRHPETTHPGVDLRFSIGLESAD